MPTIGWRWPARSSGCGSPESRSTTSAPPARRCRSSRSCGPHAGDQEIQRLRPGDYDESDVKVRSGRGSRPRTKTRPEHADAEAAMVVSVDRGRWGCVLGGVPIAGSRPCGPANWAAPRSSSATTSISSVTCPGARTPWPASCAGVRGERCCGAPPMTPIPPSAWWSPTPTNC